MRITESQLRRIVKRLIKETKSFARPQEIEDAYEELYPESGLVTIETLASYLGMSEGDLMDQISNTRLSYDPQSLEVSDEGGQRPYATARVQPLADF